MLTKDQAEVVASALVAGERARSAPRNDASTSVPSLYRSAALIELPLNEQVALLREARRSALSGGYAKLLAASWLCVIAVTVWLVMPGLSMGSQRWTLITVIVIVGLILRSALVRLRLQDILLRRSKTTQRDA